MEAEIRQIKADTNFIKAYSQRTCDVLQSLDDLHIADLIAELRAARDRDAVSWFFGNGGKAAIAQEFASDISNGVLHADPAFRVGSLVGNDALVTALANDFDYSEIFSRQLAIYARPGDLCVGMTGSGHSLNVLDAFRKAKEMDLRTFAIVGMDGGRIMTDYRQYVDMCIHIPTDSTEDGVIEDCMLFLCHLCTMRFRDEFRT